MTFKVSGLCVREGAKGRVRPGPRKVLEESQSEAERADFPQSGQKCPSGDGESKCLHPWLAWLLRDCEHEDNDAEMG